MQLLAGGAGRRRRLQAALNPPCELRRLRLALTQWTLKLHGGEAPRQHGRLVGLCIPALLGKGVPVAQQLAQDNADGENIRCPGGLFPPQVLRGEVARRARVALLQLPSRPRRLHIGQDGAVHVNHAGDEAYLYGGIGQHLHVLRLQVAVYHPGGMHLFHGYQKDLRHRFALLPGGVAPVQQSAQVVAALDEVVGLVEELVAAHTRPGIRGEEVRAQHAVLRGGGLLQTAVDFFHVAHIVLKPIHRRGGGFVVLEEHLALVVVQVARLEGPGHVALGDFSHELIAAATTGDHTA